MISKGFDTEWRSDRDILETYDRDVPEITANELGTSWKEELDSDRSDFANCFFEIIQNKLDGLRREKEVEMELHKQYSEKEGYSVESEMYLRDKNGKIVVDSVTGSKRRVDFVVIKDDKVIRMIEVTSETANKVGQSEKEQRIRVSGGNYVYSRKYGLLKIEEGVQTEIVRKK